MISSRGERPPPDEDAAVALRRRHGPRVAELLEREPAWAQDFTDLSQEWRRLFAELFGTLLLVAVGAGGAVLDAKTHGGPRLLGQHYVHRDVACVHRD